MKNETWPTGNKDMPNSKHFNRALFDQSLDGILISDFKGNILEVNTAMCSRFGYSREELLSRNISSLIDQQELAERPIHCHRRANIQ